MQPERWFVPALVACAGLAPAQEDAAARRSEPATLQSIGPIAFAPETLLISDPVGARIFAVPTGELGGTGLAADEVIAGLDHKIAAALGTTPEEVRIVDLAVHPDTGHAFVALTRGRGPDAEPLVLVVSSGGAIELLDLAERELTSVRLPNAPEPGEGRRRDQHLESITDLAHVGGVVVAAGLSNEEFASKLRVLRFPFGEADAGTSIEIYHGAHGQLETRSPVRTFVPYELAGEPHLLAAYTCTPLVQIRMRDLQPGAKVQGKTVAELGNRNRPLDMIAYEVDGEHFLLVANSSRGVMKIAAGGLSEAAAIRSRVERGGTAGLPYETIEELQGVVQLDKLDAGHAVILVENEDGSRDLRVIALP